MRARELSEDGIHCGVQAGHTYVKVAGNAGPDVRLSARPWGNPAQRAVLGDRIRARGASFRVRVFGGAGRTLLVVKDGVTVATVPVADDDFVHRFEGSGSGHWRVQVNRGTIVDTVTSPISVLRTFSYGGYVERRRCG